MDIKRKDVLYSFQFFVEWILKLCPIYLLGILVIEMVYLSIKLYSFNTMPCIQDGIQNSTVLKDQKFIESVRIFCWTLGYFKDKFVPSHARDGPTLHLAAFKIPMSRNLTLWTSEEQNYTHQIIILHYCLFLVQIIFYFIQNKIDFFHTTIERIKDRPLIWYCVHDHRQLSCRIKTVIESSYLYFSCELLVQLVYHALLLGLICSTKLVLFGQYPVHEFNLKNLVLFPEFPLFEVEKLSDSTEDIKLIDQTFRKNLNTVFEYFWLMFLGVLVIYGLLLIVKLVQYLIPALRNRTIESFSPEVDLEILENLNSCIGNYHFLFKVAKEVDHFNFAQMIAEVFFVKKDKIRHEEEQSAADQRQSDSVDEHTGSISGGLDNIKLNVDSNFDEKSNDSNDDRMKSEEQQFTCKSVEFDKGKQISDNLPAYADQMNAKNLNSKSKNDFNIDSKQHPFITFTQQFQLQEHEIQKLKQKHLQSQNPITLSRKSFENVTIAETHSIENPNYDEMRADPRNGGNKVDTVIEDEKDVIV